MSEDTGHGFVDPDTGFPYVPPEVIYAIALRIQAWGSVYEALYLTLGEYGIWFDGLWLDIDDDNVIWPLINPLEELGAWRAESDNRAFIWSSDPDPNFQQLANAQVLEFYKDRHTHISSFEVFADLAATFQYSQNDMRRILSIVASRQQCGVWQLILARTAAIAGCCWPIKQGRKHFL